MKREASVASLPRSKLGSVVGRHCFAVLPSRLGGALDETRRSLSTVRTARGQAIVTIPSLTATATA